MVSRRPCGGSAPGPEPTDSSCPSGRGGDLLRCNATGREAQLLRLTDTVSDATLEVLRRDPGKAGHWTSSTAQLDLRVRGLLPFAGRNLYGPVFDPGDDDGKGLGARFRHPVGLALLGNAYDGLATCVIADAESHVLRTVTRDGTVTTAWGHPGAAGFQDGLKEAARFNRPTFVASALAHPDPNRDFYSTDFVVADTGNHALRWVDGGGEVTTLAGTGKPGYKDGKAREAQFNQPQGVAMDLHHNVYVADAGNHVIRKIDVLGDVTTLAGTPGKAGDHDGRGAEATFTALRGLALDGYDSTTLYAVDGHSIRKLTTEGRVTTVLGQVDQPGFLVETRSDAPEGHPPCLNRPCGITSRGRDLLIADEGNRAIRLADRRPDGTFHLATLAGDPAWGRPAPGPLRDSLPWAAQADHGSPGAVRGVVACANEGGMAYISTGNGLMVLSSYAIPWPDPASLVQVEERLQVGQPFQLQWESPNGHSSWGLFGYRWTLRFLDEAGHEAAPAQEGRAWFDHEPQQITVIINKGGEFRARFTAITDQGVTLHKELLLTVH